MHGQQNIKIKFPWSAPYTLTFITILSQLVMRWVISKLCMYVRYQLVCRST